MVLWGSNTQTPVALIDSGADKSFIDATLVCQWGIPLTQVHMSLVAHCVIDLLPGTNPPRRHLYSLLAPESKAMEEYICEALAAGIIHPSLFPMGAWIIFIGKKDGLLHPYIDYHHGFCYRSSTIHRIYSGTDD